MTRLLVPVIAALCAISTGALDFYVSTTGSDSNDGSLNAPWATPFPALNAIAAAKSAGVLPSSVVVHIASGTYFLSRTLNITAAAGGDGVGHTVTFAGPADPAAPPAVLSAGAPVNAKWNAVPSAPGVFSAPAPAGAAGLSMVRQMWDAATGTRIPLSRSPISYAAAVGQWGAAWTPADFPLADARALTSESEIVLWHNWVTSQNKIDVVNVSNCSVKALGMAGDPFFGAGGNFRVALQNVPLPSALAPGSFFFSFRDLYYRPVSGVAPPPNSLIVEAVPEAVVISGSAAAPVVGVTLANLTVAHAAADLESSCIYGGCGQQSVSDAVFAAVHVSDAVGVQLTGVEIAGTGSYSVWFDTGSVASGITSSWLHDLGAGGVRVGTGNNTGSVATSPARSITVADNTVEDGGHITPAGTGIFVQEAYNTSVVHNHVHHLFYTGVAIGWTWGYAADADGSQTVGWNHIHDIFQQELSDGGCVYNLGRSPGTQIVNNLCHDVDSYGYGGWGLYTDEGSSNVTIRDNIVYATKDAAFHQHYGTDNLVTNNVFAFASTLPCDASVQGQCDMAAVRSSQHMECWTPDYHPSDAGCNSSFALIGNILLMDVENVGPNGDVNATTDLFFSFCANDHPEINGLHNKTYGRNVYWSDALANPLDSLEFGLKYQYVNFSEWQTLYDDVDSVVADPLFANASARNFTLLAGSPALGLGFQQIDMSSVGPRVPFRRAV